MLLGLAKIFCWGRFWGVPGNGSTALRLHGNRRAIVGTVWHRRFSPSNHLVRNLLNSFGGLPTMSCRGPPPIRLFTKLMAPTMHSSPITASSMSTLFIPMRAIQAQLGPRNDGAMAHMGACHNAIPREHVHCTIFLHVHPIFQNDFAPTPFGWQPQDRCSSFANNDIAHMAAKGHETDS